MTAANCTSSSVVSKNIIYPAFVKNTAVFHVAEDETDYVLPLDNLDTRIREIKRYHMQAQQTTCRGELHRLHQLAELLDSTAEENWTAEQLTAYAEAIYDTTCSLEQSLDEFIYPAVCGNDTKEDDE